MSTLLKVYTDEDDALLFWSVPLQQFVYRQLMYLVVIQSAISALVGSRLLWHKLTRVGGLQVPPVPQVDAGSIGR